MPALLSALSGLASSGSGSQKLASALSQLGAGSVENLGHKLSSHPGSLLEQGAGLLSSLFASSTLSGIVEHSRSIYRRRARNDAEAAGFPDPGRPGAIASKFSGKAMSAQGLASLFADQKASIASAMPSGLSLSSVPGLGSAEVGRLGRLPGESRRRVPRLRMAAAGGGAGGPGRFAVDVSAFADHAGAGSQG